MRRVLVILSVLASFFLISCDFEKKVKAPPAVTVVFDAAQDMGLDGRCYEVRSDSRFESLIDSNVKQELYYWAYKAEKQDSLGSEGEVKVWTEVSVEPGLTHELKFTPGSWRFYLRAYASASDRSAEKNVIYEGSVSHISFSSSYNVIPVLVRYNTESEAAGTIRVSAEVALGTADNVENINSVITKVKASAGGIEKELVSNDDGRYECLLSEQARGLADVYLSVYLDREPEPRTVLVLEDIQVASGLCTELYGYITAEIYRPEYRITYDLGGGESGAGSYPSYYYKGNSVEVTGRPEKRGYEFTGWDYAGKSWKKDITKFETSEGDITFTAAWKAVDYRIDYDYAGGMLEEGEKNPLSYNIENRKVVLTSPVRTGYSFAGWHLNGGTVTSGGTYSLPLGGAAFKAEWTPLAHDIIYDLAGGEESEKNQTEYRTDSTVKLSPPVRDGYIFLGWTMNGTEYGSGVTEFAPEMGEVLFTARWQAESYEIAYNLSGGTAENPKSYTTGSSVTLKTPVKDGYTFIGWSLNGGDVTDGCTFTLTTGKVTFTASWQANEYAVAYSLDGGTVTGNPERYTADTPVRLREPVRLGYEFSGWSLRGTAYPRATDTFMPKWGDITFTALWNISEYAISYNLSGGTAEGNPSAYETDSTIILNAPERTGYSFAGWRLNGGEVTEETVFRLTTGDVSFEAVWTIDEYVISYNLSGGTAENPDSYTVETGVLVLSPPRRGGYYFDGWLLEDGTVSHTGEIEVTTGNLTFTALWGVIDFAVGDTGPAGGYIFYDVDADNDEEKNDGLDSETLGWRFMECAPSDLDRGYIFGWYRPDGTNLMVGTSQAIGAGKANTKALVKAMGDTAYISETGMEKDVYAAKACMDYRQGGYDDWYLPSTGEMAAICSALKANGIGEWQDYYWTSSEKSANEVYLWYFVHITQEMIEEYGVPFVLGIIPAGASEAIDRLDYDMYVRPVRYI